MLKLYVGKPVIINDNIYVEKSKANGAMCTFKSVKRKKLYHDCEIINTDGYFDQCVDAESVEWIEVVLEEENSEK